MRLKHWWTVDRIGRWLLYAAAWLVLGLFGWLVLQILVEALPAIYQFGWLFILSSEWNPVTDEYGGLAFVYGTIASSLLALVLAWPVSLGIAIVLTEDFLPLRLRNILALLVELLASVPSVVYGLWGIFALTPLLRVVQSMLQQKAYGPGLFTAGIILAIMILPTLTAVSRSTLAALPRDLRSAALALGLTRWEMLQKVLLPAAKSGLWGAVVLALGRALGETMAVTMVIGNTPQIGPSIFAPAYTISALLANEFAEAQSDLHRGALFYGALVLLGITFIVNGLAELLVRRTRYGGIS